MKKVVRNIILGATSLSMLFAFTGCDPNGSNGDNIEPIHSDTETRPVALAIGALDENFNPFLYTSGNDGEVIGMTQISMLTSNANGEIVCGDDQATMVRDYSVTSYADPTESKVASGADTIDHTTYKFVIKNGVKDSTGADMDILDVLFNLYVYLDPLYGGSSTIYSTKIKGLNAYRAQNPKITDDSTVDYQAQYKNEAQTRYSDLLDYANGELGAKTFTELKDDIQIVVKLFKEELEKDWNSVVGTVSTYTEYNFTEDWEVYFLNEGMIGYQYYRNELNNKAFLKDANGKYYTTLDPVPAGVTPVDYIDNTNYRTMMSNALGNLTGTAREAKMKETAINYVFQKYFFLPDEDGICEDKSGMLSEILTSWTVGISGVKDEFVREAMGKDSNVGADGELPVKSISGITTEKTTENLPNGKSGVDLEGVSHDVLIIRINDVDPAAIYNFAFSVAPMHYYSTPELVTYARENWHDTTKSNRFGVKWQDSDFMDKHLQTKNDVPVGAGPYKKSTASSKFYDNGMVRYERNEYFETLGSGIENAKIKYLNYVYTTDDMITNSLIKGEIDYGEPQCTPINIQTLADHKHLYMQDYEANGFGYVGINPTYVPDRAVRVAIMLAMNPQSYIINTYYTTKYSSALYRPTSTTNFLNDYDKTHSLDRPYVFRNDEDYNGVIKDKTLKWTDNKSGTIKELVTAAGYRLENGKLTKGGKTLTLTFTIAGSSTDHPAFLMFTQAAKQLNELGFDITVKTDRTALVSLSTGKLAVWAAAWSTGIDPDMYQIYHKDSNASSTKNWGYDTIMNNANNAFDVENKFLNNLSGEIDKARKVTEEEFRTRYYVNALNDVMEMAVELPTYQRHDLGVYNRQILNKNTLNLNPSANAGLLYKIWELDYN